MKPSLRTDPQEQQDHARRKMDKALKKAMRSACCWNCKGTGVVKRAGRLPDHVMCPSCAGHRLRRLARKLRRNTLAWNVEMYFVSGRLRIFAFLGTEKDVMATARQYARLHDIRRWKAVPFPEFNSRYEGRLVRAMCPDWRLVKSPEA